MKVLKLFISFFAFDLLTFANPIPEEPSTPSTTVHPAITVPADIRKIPEEIRKKLILNEEDIPFQYRNFISIDSNGSKHLQASNDLIYRIIVPTNDELQFSIYYYDTDACVDKQMISGYMGTKRLFEMILTNETYPLIFARQHLQTWLSNRHTPWKFEPRTSFSLGGTYDFHKQTLNGELFTYQWWKNLMYVNNAEDGLWHDSMPNLQRYKTDNSTKIYFFDLNYNELGTTNCTFDFILPSYYYVAILTYDQKNTTTTFEEFSSTALVGFIAGGIVIILFLVATIGGCIYLGYIGVVSLCLSSLALISRIYLSCCWLNTNEPSSSLLDSNDPSNISNKKHASKLADGEEISFDEHLIGCYCARCRRKKKDRTKLIQSLEPNAKKIISKYVSSESNLNVITVKSQAEFSKLINNEMKKRNLKPKKGEIEAIVQKFVRCENVKAMVEQITASKNCVLKK